MMNKKSLLAVIGCVAMLGLVGCSDDDSGSCGDGIAEGSEQCDGLDLAGRTCADLVTASSGTLSCNLDCSFNTDGCSVVACGNGNREFGEECDCGSDAANLPDNCTDVNGGADANCSATCEELDLCGDGVTTGAEDCDCGTEALLGAGNIPAGCTNWNGEADSECLDTCEDNTTVTCTLGAWDECDPLVEGQCCPDDWNVEQPCSALPSGGNRCIRNCSATSDCQWSNWCLGPQFGDICWVATCVPGGDIDAAMNTFCDVPDGGSGWCLPIYGRELPSDEQYGICIEAGTMAAGATCSLGHSLDTTDRSEDMCDMGLCFGAQGAIDGQCWTFCNPDQAYDLAIYGEGSEDLPCDAGYNCFSESTIIEDPADPEYGVRGGDLAYCRPTETGDPTNGYNTCSLVTHQLLSDNSQTCADTHTDGVCVMVSFSGGGVTLGSLIGVCMQGSAATKQAWEVCDAASDVCAPGTICIEEDVFSTAAGSTRCVPYCDTTHHDQPDCAAMGAVPTANATPMCNTMSDLYQPTDIYPTRVGLCAF